MRKILSASFSVLVLTLSHSAIGDNTEREVDAARARPERRAAVFPPAPPEKFSQYQVSLELLGAGLIDSVFASYRPIRLVAFNLGVGFFPATAGAAPGNDYSIFSFPVSASLLVGNGDHLFEVLAGGALSLVSGRKSSYTGFGHSLLDDIFRPTFGLGYRYWPLGGGFHFRATAYALIFSEGVLPWGGLSFGYAF